MPKKSLILVVAASFHLMMVSQYGLTAAEFSKQPAHIKIDNKAQFQRKNNFVTELLTTTFNPQGVDTFTFVNPRPGWVFVSIEPASRRDAERRPVALIDDSDDPLVWRIYAPTHAYEAMCFLPEGRHTITIRHSIAAALSIRAIPRLIFCYYIQNPHISNFGPYDWDFLEREVLTHVNTIITPGPVQKHHFDQWLAEGKHWISNSSLMEVGMLEPNAPSADSVYDHWKHLAGAAAPGYSGFIVDEIVPGVSDNHYLRWNDALIKLCQDPVFTNRTFYGFAAGDLLSNSASLDLLKAIVRHKGQITWERYAFEKPSLMEAKNSLLTEFPESFERWQNAIPSLSRHLAFCMGYFSIPPCSLNTDPAVNFKVFLDLQYNLLATDETFGTIEGIMGYTANFTDEETLSWVHQLLRHYCIEGRRTPLTNDPYLLTHLQNPDFLDGLDGWNVLPAEPHSITVGQMHGFNWLQGRWPSQPQLNNFCRMVRSAKAPNKISQTIHDLKPNQLYSLKLVAADIEHLEKKQSVCLNITMDRAAQLEQYTFESVFPSMLFVEPYSPDRPAYMTYHYRVFKALAASAELIISDRQENDPGEIGRKTGFNFVEIQPFVPPYLE